MIKKSYGNISRPAVIEFSGDGNPQRGHALLAYVVYVVIPYASSYDSFDRNWRHVSGTDSYTAITDVAWEGETWERVQVTSSQTGSCTISQN